MSNITFAQSQPWVLEGQVLSAGKPIAQSSITVWDASGGKISKYAQVKTDNKGYFKLTAKQRPQNDHVFYIFTEGGIPDAQNSEDENKTITLMTVLSGNLPSKIVINELTTIAAIWTNAQFLNGSQTNNSIGQKIAAHNVANFVNLQTGTLSSVIQNTSNGTQTTTLAKFNTLANILAGCINKIHNNACHKLFEMSHLAERNTPSTTQSTTMAAMYHIALQPWKNTAEIFNVFKEMYGLSKNNFRKIPFVPYLSYAPSNWVLALRYSGGGLSAPVKIALDKEGNAWVTNNFLASSQSSLANFIGGVGISKMAADGRPLSPPTLGYEGGGINNPGFGIAIDTKNSIWIGSLNGKNIAQFNSAGKPISPPSGYTVHGKLGMMQGIITTESGDIWAADSGKNQIIYIPNAHIENAKIVCNEKKGNPCHVKTPFHLAIDQKNQIWVSNTSSNTVTRFSAVNPDDAAEFNVGVSPKGIAVDSQGNVWVANFLGQNLLKFPPGLNFMQMMQALWNYSQKSRLGSVNLLQPSGDQVKTIAYEGIARGPWGIAIDGNDNVWIADFSGQAVIELCGVRTQNCPAGLTTGDPISPLNLGYIEGGLQKVSDVAIDAAGNVWVANNLNDLRTCFETNTSEVISTHCAGSSVVVLYGVAKPVKTPLLGVARPVKN